MYGNVHVPSFIHGVSRSVSSSRSPVYYHTLVFQPSNPLGHFSAPIMFQPERMEAFYYPMDSSPLSDLSDLDGGWSPVSGFSDQENYPALVDNANGNAPIWGNSCTSKESASATSGGDASAELKGRGGGITKKHRNPARKSHQRNAANQRERRRMKIINDAFDGLRDRIPLDCSERKLSKVDTLRLAIRYIQHLSEMIDSCGGALGSGQSNGGGHRSTERIIIRCHNQGNTFLLIFLLFAWQFGTTSHSDTMYRSIYSPFLDVNMFKYTLD